MPGAPLGVSICAGVILIDAGSTRPRFPSTKQKIKIQKQASRSEVLVRIRAIAREPKLFWDAN